MMSYADIECIEKIIMDRSIEPHGLRVLEWGAGNSTIHFPKCDSHIPGIEQWISVEHNGHYVDYLQDKIAENVTLIWVQDGADYVDCVKKNIAKYDIILIDGKEGSREYCLEAAMNMVKPDGIILLHDAYRREYAEFVKKYPNRKELTPGEIPDGEYFIHRGLMAFYPYTYE